VSVAPSLVNPYVGAVAEPSPPRYLLAVKPAPLYVFTNPVESAKIPTLYVSLYHPAAPAERNQPSVPLVWALPVRTPVLPAVVALPALVAKLTEPEDVTNPLSFVKLDRAVGHPLTFVHATAPAESATRAESTRTP